MRRLLLLMLPAVAAADDGFEARLQAFEKARESTLEPGGQARVYPAVEALVATKDVRAVAPVAGYLLETILSERRLLEDSRKAQKEIADEMARAEDLAREVKQLELKEKAGDRTVGPLMERKSNERAACQREADRRMKDIEQIDRTVGFLHELRNRLADDCIALLKGRTGEEADAGIRGVCRALDRADHDQGLLLVRILAASGLAQAEEQLVEILSDRKSDGAVRLKTQYALAGRLTRRGAEAILRLWERDPRRAGDNARHVLSTAAKKRLATIEDARAWVATLP